MTFSKNTPIAKFAVLLFLVQFITRSSLLAQGPVTLCLGQDTTVCPGQTVVINNCNSGTTPGTAAGLYLNAPSSVTLSDDSWSGAVSIGFPFSFYGNTYSQCVIGSNGLISFNLTNAGGYCPWALTGVGQLPSATFASAKNSIMLTYQDINPSLGGQIQYQTIGTAPNRKFVVLYKNIMMFSCTSQCNYMAIILYETTNVFELHIGNKPICSSWNSGLAIQGSENNMPAPTAHITPGRNNTVWGANQDGRRFLPTSPTNTASYTMSQIPYVMVNSPGSNFVWANTNGQTFPYNNGTLNVNIIPPGTTGYFLSGAACGTSIGSITQDTTWITRATPSVTTTVLPDVCSQGIGSATATPGAGSPAPCTYTWNPGAITGNPATNLTAGTYTVTQHDANGCNSTATAIITDTPANFSYTATQVSCPGGSDGTATANVSPATGVITYLWSTGANTQTVTGLSAGNYWCYASNSTGCSDTIYVTVTEIPAMVLNPINIVDANCYTFANGQATIDVTLGTAPYTYSWDLSSSLAATALDLPAGLNTCTVTDANGCIQSIGVTISQPNPLDITFLTQDTMICSESNIVLSATGAGGSTAYTFTWTENGIPIGNGSNITVDPLNSGTVYCVTLSELCGSPTTTECMTITFPQDIIAIIQPVDNQICTPGDFELHNVSTNGQDIASTAYSFSNGDQFNLPNQDTLFHTIAQPGDYDLSVIITSIHGCIYNGFFDDLLSVTPLPSANFTLSKNPVTWFETSVQTNDISSGNIAQYNWTSPGAAQITSNGSSAIISYPEGVMATYPIMLTVTTVDGCSDSITIDIDVVSDVIFYAPTAFTPDDDEHNQVWSFYIEGIDNENFHLAIYNRWGEIIWETNDPKGYWDGYYNGVKVQPGTYVWRAWYKELDTDGKTIKTGMIHVIR
ncbi:MAG: gliding motility-associated C-terminal domain-containing protein [Flavobacteriales bacterium]